MASFKHLTSLGKLLSTTGVSDLLLFARVLDGLLNKAPTEVLRSTLATNTGIPVTDVSQLCFVLAELFEMHTASVSDCLSPHHSSALIWL